VKKTAAYYRKHPEAYRRKLEYDTDRNASPEKKRYRAELARERRKRGVMGKGGKDVSHVKGGGFKMEAASRNRARNGTAKGRPRAVRRGTKASR
jgi:hypothetical protein